MGNTENLRPVQSEEEAREKGRKGGIVCKSLLRVFQ